MKLSKLCGNNVDKLCAFCEHSSPLMDEKFSLCKYYGTVENTHKCRKYKYNPLKRNPPKRVKIKTSYDFGDL